MSKDNVINFPGATRLKIDPDKVLTAAVGNLESVIVIGYDKTGMEYFAASDPSGPEALWLLERAKAGLISIASGVIGEDDHY